MDDERHLPDSGPAPDLDAEETCEPLYYGVPRRRPVARRRLVPDLVVDPATCTGCGICIDVCPFDAVQVERTAAIDPGRCGRCGICINACPEGALDWPPSDSR